MTHGGGLTFSQNFGSPALSVLDRQCLQDSELKDDRLNESVNDFFLLMTKVFIEQPRKYGSKS